MTGLPFHRPGWSLSLPLLDVSLGPKHFILSSLGHIKYSCHHQRAKGSIILDHRVRGPGLGGHKIPLPSFVFSESQEVGTSHQTWNDRIACSGNSVHGEQAGMGGWLETEELPVTASMGLQLKPSRERVLARLRQPGTYQRWQSGSEQSTRCGGMCL